MNEWENTVFSESESDSEDQAEYQYSNPIISDYKFVKVKIEMFSGYEYNDDFTEKTIDLTHDGIMCIYCYRKILFC